MYSDLREYTSQRTRNILNSAFLQAFGYLCTRKLIYRYISVVRTSLVDPSTRSNENFYPNQLGLALACFFRRRFLGSVACL